MPPHLRGQNFFYSFSFLLIFITFILVAVLLGNFMFCLLHFCITNFMITITTTTKIAPPTDKPIIKSCEVSFWDLVVENVVEVGKLDMLALGVKVLVVDVMSPEKTYTKHSDHWMTFIIFVKNIIIHISTYPFFVEITSLCFSLSDNSTLKIQSWSSLLQSTEQCRKSCFPFQASEI